MGDTVKVVRRERLSDGEHGYGGDGDAFESGEPVCRHHAVRKSGDA